jgi:hypothetical protein
VLTSAYFVTAPEQFDGRLEQFRADAVGAPTLVLVGSAARVATT